MGEEVDDVSAVSPHTAADRAEEELVEVPGHQPHTDEEEQVRRIPPPEVAVPSVVAHVLAAQSAQEEGGQSDLQQRGVRSDCGPAVGGSPRGRGVRELLPSLGRGRPTTRRLLLGRPEHGLAIPG